MGTRMHILTPVFLFASVLFLLFSSDNPVVILGVFLLVVPVLAANRQGKKLKTGLFFASFMVLFILVFNLIFVSSGVTELAVILGKRITLESILYAFLMGAKLLAVTYLFFTAGVLIDGDKAVSYCGSKLSKSTLTFLLIFRLIPYYTETFTHLKDVYATRGLEFEGTPLKEKLKSYRTVLSVLLEQSLESSFEIGEAAYTRGFLSTKRSVYDRPRFHLRDGLTIAGVLLLLGVYFWLVSSGIVAFNLYFGEGAETLFHPLWGVFLLVCVGLSTVILLTDRRSTEHSEVIWDI